MIQCFVLLLEMFLSFSFNCWTAVRVHHLMNLDQVADNKASPVGHYQTCLKAIL